MYQMHKFRNSDKEVPARRHSNPSGTVGGWVADSAHVDSGAYVDWDAEVSGHAHVFDGAQVYGDVGGDVIIPVRVTVPQNEVLQNQKDVRLDLCRNGTIVAVSRSRADHNMEVKA